MLLYLFTAFPNSAYLIHYFQSKDALEAVWCRALHLPLTRTS